MAGTTINGSSVPKVTATSSPRENHGLLTFADAIDHLVEWSYGHGGEGPQSLLRECVQAAYTDVLNATDWPSLTTTGRIQLRRPQIEGSIEYDQASRIATIDGATWPDWAVDAVLRIGYTDCHVEGIVSPTQIILDSQMNPGRNIQAWAAYTLYCQWYALPADFKAIRGFMDQKLWDLAEDVTMVEIMRLYKLALCTGFIRARALAERPHHPGERAIWVYPAPQTDRPGDFIYERRPREMLYTGKDAADQAGTIAVTEGTLSVVGTGTAWEPAMRGAMLRIGDATYWPTGTFGLHRYKEQIVIASVEDATHLTLAAAPKGSYAGVKYVITDSVEIEPCAAYAFRRYCEMHMALSKGIAKPETYIALAEKAMLDAMAGAYPSRNDAASDVGHYQGMPTNYTVRV
jgi:hypothetical protein